MQRLFRSRINDTYFKTDEWFNKIADNSFIVGINGHYIIATFFEREGGQYTALPVYGDYETEQEMLMDFSAVENSVPMEM